MKLYLLDGLDEVGEANEILPFVPLTELVSDAEAADLFPVDLGGVPMCFSIGDRIEMLCSGDFKVDDISNI